MGKKDSTAEEQGNLKKVTKQVEKAHGLALEAAIIFEALARLAEPSGFYQAPSTDVDHSSRYIALHGSELAYKLTDGLEQVCTELKKAAANG